jgi:hypothetical protein
MVSQQSVEQQLKRIHFNHLSWGTSEAKELHNILLADENILECVNGIYEGGFALLVATDMRVLLVDKKPLNYLTVEDLRFDMISEIDYSHRLFGARISISTGTKNLKFTSYNQPRLRKLINHVQHHMADLKKKQDNHQQGQNQHLEQINQQLQTYLLAQYQQQESLKHDLQNAQNIAQVKVPEPVEMSPELKDYMLAQRLLMEQLPAHIQATAPHSEQASISTPQPIALPVPHGDPANPQLADLYAEGMQEIFGRRTPTTQAYAPVQPVQTQPAAALDVNPISIAYSKLPMALRNRKFGRPSFHAHSQAPQPTHYL